MSILFKDFIPEKISKGGFLSLPKYEDFESTVDALNEWKERNSHYEIINIETVLLPNIYNSGEEGSTDTHLRTSGDMSSYWYQIIRVWYKVSSEFV